MNSKLLDIINRNKNLIYRLAYAQTHNQHNSDDIFQEVVLRFLKRKPEFHSLEHEKAWFIRVTINCCKTYFLSFWNTKTVEYDDNLGVVELSDYHLNELLKKLPKRYNVILYLFYYEDYSIKEIANLLKLKENNVKVLLYRARLALKKELEENL